MEAQIIRGECDQKQDDKEKELKELREEIRRKLSNNVFTRPEIQNCDMTGYEYGNILKIRDQARQYQFGIGVLYDYIDSMLLRYYDASQMQYCTALKHKYDRLWEYLKQKGMTKTDLQRATDIGMDTIHKMSGNVQVSTDVLMKICNALHCDFGDIVEFVESNSDDDYLDESLPRRVVVSLPANIQEKIHSSYGHGKEREKQQPGIFSCDIHESTEKISIDLFTIASSLNTFLLWAKTKKDDLKPYRTIRPHGIPVEEMKYYEENSDIAGGHLEGLKAETNRILWMNHNPWLL